MELEKKRSGIEQKFYDLTTKIVTENEYVLYDVEYVSASSTLRVFIMDPETGTAIIEDCVVVDKAFSPYCEDEEYKWIPDDFMLEVSSPGVYRSLKVRDHFNASVDKIIAMTLNGKLTPEQSEGLSNKLKNTNKLRGILVEVNNDNIKINLDSVEVLVNFKQIKKASLDPDING
jgi:ribosome maturation factor RimP